MTSDTALCNDCRIIGEEEGRNYSQSDLHPHISRVTVLYSEPVESGFSTCYFGMQNAGKKKHDKSHSQRRASDASGVIRIIPLFGDVTS